MTEAAAGILSGTENRALQEYLQAYNKLTAHCFDNCIHDFTTRKILSAENSCSMNCVEKYMAVTQRLTQRFAEQSEMVKMMAMGEKAPGS